ncbi:MAG TPA: HAD-IA family hydrolase [Chloroflexota bacterium]|nr:HAD-IA family hydrolase [Chloroflexota bacterium]
MKPFALVIFDCDGVLVDSERITTGVMAAMLQEMGVNISTEALHDRVHGRSLAQCLAVMTELLGKPLPEDFVPALRQRAAAALWAEVTPIPGVAEALTHIETAVTVASSGEREKMLLTLGRTGLLARFGNNIYSAADVSHAKPAPDIYLHAARQNGVAPHACAVVEDSPAGVQAGVAAGMTVFGYAAATPAQQLKEAGAHVVFSDMTQLPALLN